MKYKNNPLNIRWNYRNKWKGLCGQRNGFCEFCHIRYGIRAAAYLLMRSYRFAGARTYAQLIKRWAPSSENPTQKYIEFVCDRLHVFPFDEPKTRKQFAGLINALWWFEQGCPPDLCSQHILEIINDFQISPYGVK